MQFNRSPQVHQLYVSDDLARPGTVLYLLPEDASNPPPSISFADSWNAFAGVYVLVGQALAPSAVQAFVTAAWAFLADPRNRLARFAWMAPLDPSGLAAGTVVGVQGPESGPWATAYPATLGFRNVALDIPAGTEVTVDESSASFSFTQSGQSIKLTAGWGSSTAGRIGSAVVLPMTGPLGGCLQLGAALSLGDLTALDAGLRWYYAIPPDRDHPQAFAADYFLGSLRCPVVAEDVTLYPNLDPLAPLDPTRTFLAFNCGDAGEKNVPAPAVTSYLSATMGYAFGLQPLAAEADGHQPAAPTAVASLVFAVNRQSTAPSDHDPYCLVPRGDFQLQTSRTGTVDLMCGLSGVEYLQLAAPGTPTTLSFVPGNASFAQGYYPREPAGWTNLTPAVPPTTSFATTTAATGVAYFAQPDQSVLYNYGDLSGTGPDPITPLAAVPVQAATITQPPSSAPVFPLLPYAGTGGERPEPYAQLESQVVSPQRRGLIAASAGLAAAPAAANSVAATPVSKYSTTPQGLLATYLAGAATWQEIVLAQMPAAPELTLENVNGRLLSAFQSSQLFLVASEPSAIQSYLVSGHDQIAIGPDPSSAWLFDLDPAQWQSYSTVLIVKFSALSIEELAGNTATWAYADEFNADADTTSQQILDAIKSAPLNDPDLQTFRDAMTSPAWNGIIALNVRAPLTGLPPELAGLAAGIDPAQFKAHHVGINASKIIVPSQPGDLSIHHSSIFGLIHYQGEPPRPGGGDYAFEVEQLKVLFLNASVASFSSVIDLEINTLFGENATQKPPATDNVVRLFGVYQRQPGADGKPQGSYVFQTQSGQASVFEMTSGVLNAVVLSKGQFVTVTQASTTSLTNARFLFWGLIDFKELPFDLFSFGGPATPGGLGFGNLAIDMSIDPRVTPTVPAFAFDARQLSLDVATSGARDASLFKHFPLKLTSFTQGDAGAAPTDLGYMGLTTPLTQSTVTYPWFSLNFDLDLGTAGALAAEAGLVASLTAAWSPNAGGYTVFSGLKLPGSSGSKRQISIEGLFNIGFKSLEILVPAPGTYVLVLYGIGFKFLSLTFPPSGQVNFTLFGDPDATTDNTSLGWYAAYAKDQAQGQGRKQQALEAGRH
jgi:hypothetical protein